MPAPAPAPALALFAKPKAAPQPVPEPEPKLEPVLVAEPEVKSEPQPELQLEPEALPAPDLESEVSPVHELEPDPASVSASAPEPAPAPAPAPAPVPASAPAPAPTVTLTEEEKKKPEPEKPKTPKGLDMFAKPKLGGAGGLNISSMGKLKAKASEAKRRASVNMSKKKLDVGQTVTKRLEKLESAKEEVEKAMKKVLNDEIMKFREESKRSLTEAAMGSVNDMIPGGFDALLDRIKVMEKFFIGFDSMSHAEEHAHEVTPVIPSLPSTPKAASFATTVEHDAAALKSIIDTQKDQARLLKEQSERIRAQEEREKELEKTLEAEREKRSKLGEKMLEEMTTQQKATIDDMKKQQKLKEQEQQKKEQELQERLTKAEAGSKLANALNEDLANLKKTEDMSKSNPNGVPTPSKEESTVIKETIIKEVHIVEPPKVEKPSVSAPLNNTGLVWRLTSSQKALKDEIKELRDNFSEILQHVKRQPRRSSLLRELKDGININVAGDELDNLDANDDILFLKSEIDKLADQLKKNYFSKGEVESALNSDDTGEDKFEKLKSSDVFVKFRANLQNTLDTLNTNKMEKSLFSQELEKYEAGMKRQLDAWSSRSKEEMQASLDGFRVDVSNLKSYVEQVADDAGSQSVSVSKEELDSLLAQSQRKMETNLQRALTAGVIEDLNQKVKELSAMIGERPTDQQITSMLAELETALKLQFGDSRTIQTIIENLKMDLRRKVTKKEVLSILGTSMDEVTEKLRNPDDTLMIGRIPARCLSCNQTVPMHKSRAKTVNHKMMSPISSTFADSGRGQYLVENGVVVMAKNASGRGGALKPLGLRSPPGIPLNNQAVSNRASSPQVGIRHRGRSGLGNSGSRPVTAPSPLAA